MKENVQVLTVFSCLPPVAFFAQRIFLTILRPWGATSRSLSNIQAKPAAWKALIACCFVVTLVVNVPAKTAVISDNFSANTSAAYTSSDPIGASQTTFFDNTTVGVICPTITFTATPSNTCPGGSNGQIAVSGVSGGVGPYMYSKDNGINYQAGATFTGLAATTYQVVVKDADGCTSGATPVVVGTNSPPACIVNGADFVCNNSTGNVYSAPGGMSAYSWSISGDGSIPGSTTGQSVSVTAGNYVNMYTVSVTVTDANGCTSSCSKQSYIFLFTPPANITVNPNPVCFGATLDLSISSASSSTVSWSGEGIVNPNGNFIPTGDPYYFNNVTTAIPTTTGPHTYGVSVVAQNGCSNTGSVNVTVDPSPTLFNMTGGGSYCSGGPGVEVGLSGSEIGAQYDLYRNGNFVSSLLGTGNPLSFGLQTTAGNYQVIGIIASNCQALMSGSAVVTINSPPVCSITFDTPPTYPWGQSDSTCAGNTYVFNGTPGMSSYHWSILGGTVNGSTTGASVSITTGNGSSFVLIDTITDANGCRSICLLNVPNKPSPTCSVSGPPTVCGNSTGNVYAVTSNGQVYSWSISGNGTIVGSSTGSSVSVTAGVSGTYTITVASTSSLNGCATICSQTVSINSAPTPAITGPTLVCSGGSATLDAGPGYATYAWSGSGGSGQTATFNNITSPTTYTVTVTDGISCTGTDSHTVSIQNCNSNIEFSGKIIWENDDVSGVKNATVRLTGSATGSALTDVNGDFLITTSLTSGSFTLKPVKNLNKFNGVNAGDVTAIQQHVTFANPITDPYKLVCADVNKSNSVTTLDASLITQALLGNPAANAQFNTSWRFVPSNYALSVPPWGFPEQRTYTGISGPQTNQDFIGMKIGDVTGDANPANFGPEFSGLVLRSRDRVLQSGETIDVAVSADQLDDLAAFQFGLRFDPAQLQFVEVNPASGGPLSLTADNFGLYNIAAGEIRTVWTNAAGLRVEEAAPVFHLRFTALKSGAKLSEAMYLDNAVLPGLAFTSKLAESTVTLHFDAATGTNDPVASILNMQIRPNPFRETTTVSFTLPETGDVQLRVLDVNGRELLRINNTYPAGNNSETLRLEGITASGVLMGELVTPFGVATRKLVVAR